MQFNSEDKEIPVENRKPILLYITSNGGEVDSGFELIDIIRNSKTPVYTINLGYQYSMGFLIGLAGHKRFAMPTAKFLMHDGSNFLYGSGTKVQDQMKFQAKIEKRIKEYVLSRSNVTSEEYDSKLRVETVVLLSHKKPDSVINVKVEFGEGEGKIPLDNIEKRAESYKPKERVTYKMIKEYIEEKYGFKVHTAYIAEVKRDLGLPMYDAPNAVEELKQPRKHPTPEKVEAIKDALKHFEII